MSQIIVNIIFLLFPEIEMKLNKVQASVGDLKHQYQVYSPWLIVVNPVHFPHYLALKK